MPTNPYSRIRADLGDPGRLPPGEFCRDTAGHLWYALGKGNAICLTRPLPTTVPEPVEIAPLEELPVAGYLPGPLGAQTYAAVWYPHQAGVLTEVRLRLCIPFDENFVARAYLNDAEAATITIPAGDHEANAAGLTLSFAPGDRLRLDLVTVPTGEPTNGVWIGWA